MAAITDSQGGPGSENGGLILSPQMTSSGEVKQRAIRDGKMAKDVVQTIVQANRTRNVVNSRILAKYNAERPYDQTKLESEGLGWRSNFTTKPMAMMVEKVFPRFVEAVQGLRWITNSSLSDKWMGATEKTTAFREEITKTVRTAPGWTVFLDDISLVNSMFGHSVVAWLDEYACMPTSFRQDESFVSDGTKQLSESAQVVVLKETLLPHELFEKIKDQEAAQTAGWNIKECIRQINNASPSQLRETLAAGGNTETWYQNAFRELSVGASYMAGASVITLYNILVREADGKVSHYRLAGTEMNEIFTREDRFDTMSSCVSFFAYQKGNGTLHGSKGVGRDIYELAAMQDRVRNEVVDRLIMSGKTLVQGDPKRIHQFRMHLVGNVALIPANWTVLEQKFDGNVESFLKFDAYIGMLVDQLIGATTPRTFQGDRVTKAEVDLFASREEEGKDAKIRRFLDQFVVMVQEIQRRLCDPDTTEPEAKAMQARLLKKMTREELDELAASPVAETVRDLTPAERQLVVAVAAEKKGHPLYNQRALEVEDLTARLSREFADRVLLPENDPTETVEQQRLQQMELAILTQGQPVPVSPRDNHEVHLAMLMPFAIEMGKGVLSGQVGTALLEVVAAHIGEHYNRALSAGVPKEKLSRANDFLKQAGQALEQLKAMDAQASQLQQASQQHDLEESAAQDIATQTGLPVA